MNIKHSVALLSTALFLAACLAGEAGEKGKWVVISEGVVEQLNKEATKIAWPGLTAGIACDRSSGDVYMIVAGQGTWRSSDQGKTFERLDGGKVGGRCETSYSLDFDPNGKRAAYFMLDGPGAMTLDNGKTWTDCKDKSRGFDNAAVDWSQETPKTIFAVRHEAGGLALVSQDAGKTYKEIGADCKNFKNVGVFGEQIFVATKEKQPGILRSTDAGATWTKVSDLSPSGLVARVFNGVGYWTSAQGLLVSKDKGVTWAVQGSPVAAGAGPYFGKDEKNIVVVTKAGLTETTDGGQSWTVAAPLPSQPGYEFSPNGWFVNFGWDPVHNVFYISRMGKPAMKFERP
jgi:photosystem II stability/assembly factor-like uncharacterized protein